MKCDFPATYIVMMMVMIVVMMMIMAKMTKNNGDYTNTEKHFKSYLLHHMTEDACSDADDHV